jgi:hypothetical protein
MPVKGSFVSCIDEGIDLIVWDITEKKGPLKGPFVLE